MGAGGAGTDLPSGNGAANGGSGTGGVKLVGYNNFVRHNSMSDKFKIHDFHHMEFWCADATNTFKRFQHGLGMTLVSKSDQSTNNTLYASYVLRSSDLVFAFSAPYSRAAGKLTADTPLQHYSPDQAYEFVNKHGLGVRAVGLRVEDAAEAYEIATKNGGKGVLAPVVLQDKASGTSQTISEVSLYGDVVIRFVSGTYTGPFLAGYIATPEQPQISYGLKRMDHAVGNAHVLVPTLEYIMGFTGFHEFAEFIAEDVGTVDSGLNSMVLANNSETVLLPINEPTFGTPRKSQIQTYLEQNEGPGLQHMALKTDDIFHTLREMQARSFCGGFEFMPKASAKYYKELPKKIGDVLTAEQYKQVEEMGILVDRDDQGVLLQIFTKPLGDRPTVFIEIIQRVGCMKEVKHPETNVVHEEQAAGCGGFGKGNFTELFKSIEDYERTLNV